MSEKLCIVCKKIPTNHPSRKCVMCMLEGRLPPQASQRELQNEKPTKAAILCNGTCKGESGISTCPLHTTYQKEEVMPVTEENKGRKCSVKGCFKFAVKGGMCIKHFNEAHGIKKRRGRKPTGETASPDAKKRYRYPCEVSGCKKGYWKDKRCMVHWKEKYGISKKKSQVSLQSPKKVIECKSASRGKAVEPESKKITPVIPAKSDFCGIRQTDDEGASARTTGDILRDFYIISVDFSFYPKLHEKLLKLADEDFRNPGQQLLSMLHHTLKDAEART